MTNGDWIRTLDDAKANELFNGWIPCEDWGKPGELVIDNDEELAKILSDYSNTCRVCSYWGMCTQYGYPYCYDGIYEWIKQEHEEDGYDKQRKRYCIEGILKWLGGK